MMLDADGVEYAKWTITADVPLVTAPKARITRPAQAMVLYQTEWAGGTSSDTTRVARLLVAGPSGDTTNSPVVLAVGRNLTALEITEGGPEVVVRSAGSITVT